MELAWEKETGINILGWIIKSWFVFVPVEYNIDKGGTTWSWMWMKPIHSALEKYTWYKNGDGLAAMLHLKPLYIPCQSKQREVK